MLKKTKLILAIMLAAVLCLAGIPGIANAANEDPVVEAFITKQLHVPFGTTYPDDFEFTFDIEKISVDGSEEQAMPEIPSVTIEFDGTEELETPDPNSSGNSVYWLEGEIDLSAIVWPSAGAYTYKITESSGTFTDTVAAPDTETLTNSLAEYEITIVVADGGADFEVYHIYAKKTVTDAGEELDEITKTVVNKYETDFDYSQVIFANTYTKTIDTDPEDGYGSLYIEKMVDGADADEDLAFSFNVTVTAPQIVLDQLEDSDPAPTYTAGIYSDDDSDGDWTLVSAVPSFESGVAATITLKHGQRLIFADLPVGTTYEVTEAATTNYTPSVEIEYNEIIIGEKTGTWGSSLTVPSFVLKEGVADTPNDMLFVGETATGAGFLNTFSDTPPTGISLNNMAYFGLILLAIAGLVFFIIFKSRKKSNDEA